MKQIAAILHADGRITRTEIDAPIPAQDETYSYVPTAEDRLSALESAMLTMMGVDSNV